MLFRLIMRMRTGRREANHLPEGFRKRRYLIIPAPWERRKILCTATFSMSESAPMKDGLLPCGRPGIHFVHTLYISCICHAGISNLLLFLSYNPLAPPIRNQKVSPIDQNQKGGRRDDGHRHLALPHGFQKIIRHLQAKDGVNHCQQ